MNLENTEAFFDLLSFVRVVEFWKMAILVQPQFYRQHRPILEGLNVWDHIDMKISALDYHN